MCHRRTPLARRRRAVIDPPSPDEAGGPSRGRRRGSRGPCPDQRGGGRRPGGGLADAIGELPVEAMRQVLSALGPGALAEVIAEVDPQTAAEVLLRLTRPEAPTSWTRWTRTTPRTSSGSCGTRTPPRGAAAAGDGAGGGGRPAAPDLPRGHRRRDHDHGLHQRPGHGHRGAGGAPGAGPGADDVPESPPPTSKATEPGPAGGGRPLAPPGAGERVPARLISPQVVSVPASADQETVARVVRDYRLLAVPVVDDQGPCWGSSPRTTWRRWRRRRPRRTSSASSGAQPLDEPYLARGALPPGA